MTDSIQNTTTQGGTAVVKTVRAFIAFELPGHIISVIKSLQQDLKKDGPRLRWVRPQNIHLTLKFLGNIQPKRIPAVERAMTQALQGKRSLALKIQGMGVFPGIRRPRVLWIGLGGDIQALEQLQAVLENALDAEAFERDRRPFKAHLTLARMPKRIDGRRLLQVIEKAGNFNTEEFFCNELILFQSDLRPQGAIYTPLKRISLHNNTDQEGV
jgi:2'-5' RNA ligase